MTQRIEISGSRFRIFLANRAIALGWALRGPANHVRNGYSPALGGSFQRRSAFLSTTKAQTVTIAASSSLRLI